MQSLTSTSSLSLPDWHSAFNFKAVLERHWRGGIRLRDYKDLSNGKPIRTIAPGQLLLAIPTELGRSRATPCVKPGDAVLKGQVIANGDDKTLWVHASTSGIVREITRVRVADREAPAEAILIASDGQERWLDRRAVQPPKNLSELAGFAMRMGLAGLGGAGFPTGLKLSGTARPDLLLINGAECEPFLTCDDRLMRERAGSIIQAADYLGRLLGVGATRIGVETNKPEAIRALRQAIGNAGSSVEVRRLPQRYPAGGQPMLIRSLCGRRLRPGQLPAEIGVQVLNVATLHALGRAVFHGEPMVSRIVTLTGDCGRPGNVEIPLGFPVERLRQEARAGNSSTGIQVGGPMMGRRLDDIDAVIGKTSSCLIFGADSLLPAKGPEAECIRCNRCVDVCPMALQPMSMFAAARHGDHTALHRLRLDACIECGACSQACPSNLPLRDSFRRSKRESLICRAG